MLTRLNPNALRALALLAGTVLLLLSLAGYAWQRFGQHRTARAIERTVQQHQARATTDARAQGPADSTANVLRGRLAEASRSQTISARSYDSLRRLYPGAELPAQPPRYRPAR